MNRTPPAEDLADFAGIDREIDQIIGDEDGEALYELETMRRKYLFRYYIGLAAILSTTILFICALFQPHRNLSDIVMGLWMLSVLFGLSPIWNYKSKAKKILMPALVRLFGDLKWSEEAPYKGCFWQDQQVRDLIGFYQAETLTDYIAGSMKGTNIALAELILTGKMRTIVAIHIRLQKSMPLRIVVKPRAIEWDLAPDLAEIKIPSPDFARIFRAFSDDQVLARMLLTPDVVERLTKLNALFDNQHMGAGVWGEDLFLIACGAEEMAPVSLFTSAYKLEHVRNVGRRLYLLSTFTDAIVRNWRLSPAAVIEPASVPASAIPAP